MDIRILFLLFINKLSFLNIVINFIIYLFFLIFKIIH